MVTRRNFPQNRLPPKVLSRKKKGTKRARPSKKPWYRHTPWIVSLVACGVFIVLIGGFFSVRQVIIIVRGNNTETATENDEEKQNKSTGSSVAENAASTANQSTGKAAASKTTDEPTLEVLPPKAAMQPGRKLPKMLLVGRGTNMFPELADAMKVAIGGDIIEIRHNGPLYIEPGKAVWIGEGTLTIRGGRQFQPVIVGKGDQKGNLITLGLPDGQSKSRVLIERLCMLNKEYSAVLSHVPVKISRCMFACRWVSPGRSVFINVADPGAESIIEECYFWGGSDLRMPGRFVTIKHGKLILRNNLIVNADTVLKVGGRESREGPQVSFATMQHNTIVNFGIVFGYGNRVGIESVNNIFAYDRRGSTSFWFTGAAAKAEREKPSLSYRGRRNLYWQTTFGISRVYGYEKLSGWFRFTGGKEVDVLISDPVFRNPNVTRITMAKLLPPGAFALRPNSPAKRRATDGTDIGCDLSKIPTPPPMIEKLIAQMLQKK